LPSVPKPLLSSGHCLGRDGSLPVYNTLPSSVVVYGQSGCTINLREGQLPENFVDDMLKYAVFDIKQTYNY